MRKDVLKAKLDPATGGLAISQRDKEVRLHPLWLRERVIGNGVFDPVSHQRLYEHASFPQDLKVCEVNHKTDDFLSLKFSDETKLDLSISETVKELGWEDRLENPPAAASWDATLSAIPGADWGELEDPSIMKKLLENYFSHGFCVIQNTPIERDSLKALSRRFGYLRETNFGEIFNVETKPSASDLAYTDAALSSHTDNPYRVPVPGIQFLHCIRNEVAGGLSTLVDGMKIVQQLTKESPEQAKALESIHVRFRYEGPAGILESHAPIIERDKDGLLRRLRLSSRVDYVPAVDTDTLSHFYAGRRKLHEMSNSPAYQISFPFKSGTLLMMNNYRLLHGRTAFNGKQGHRHLQGCYIDHDGPDSLYRMLVRDGKTTQVVREV